MPARLDDDCISEKLQELRDWSRVGDNIERNFEFKDFDQALSFVNKVGAEAQAMDHHPDIFLHDWNQVRITASTHSAKGITENDIELARRLNGLNT
jgi:4a-hydroxytetrahydrobiopterin dehydratase